MSKPVLKLTLASLATLALLSACSADNASAVDQSRIYTGYSVEYSADTNQLSFTGVFNFGGSTGTYLILDGGAGVSLDGVPLIRNDGIFNAVDYQSTVSAPTSAQLTATHTFVFTDTAGKTYTNATTLPATPAFTLSATTVPTTGTLTINWTVSGGTAAANDIAATITRTDTSSTQIASRNDSTGGASGAITFVAADLAAVGAGPAQVKLCHKPFTTTVNAPAVGGSLSRSYCAAYQSVTIQ